MARTTRVANKAQTTTEWEDFSRQGCGGCGTVWYWSSVLDWEARNRRRRFFCPACGRSLQYQETEADRLRRELDEQRSRAEGAVDEAKRQRSHRQIAERRVIAMKGVVTRTKNRVAKGKCVRCSCVFPDLAAHMADVHPDYAPDDE